MRAASYWAAFCFYRQKRLGCDFRTNVLSKKNDGFFKARRKYFYTK
jgi:hypothetical protein